MTKIDLITGILGAGKTTFLHYYAEYFLKQGLKIAILENDFGAVNVDRMMLQDLQSDRCQIEIIAGGGDKDCHKRRFKTQLISLGMQHFDRVLVEPSGIFDMDEFFDTLYESPLDRWFQIGSVLTIIDSEMKDLLSPQMEYLLASQSACAGKLILSKRNLQESELQIAERISTHINRALTGIQCPRQFSLTDFSLKPWSEFTEQDFETFASAGYRSERYVKQLDFDSVESEVHYFLHIAVPEEKISSMLETMLNASGFGTIFRIKGALPQSDGKALKINAVHEKIEITPVSNAQAVLIVIGDKLNYSAIDAFFRNYNTNPNYISI
ncbi:MAG: GTPase (G3E family) [Oscillospiraceae bacterium]|nr:GTPase (G3E family) [Oscillospiraceae bacterium]MBR7084060.1 GTPase (G3E family) [Oscillospiraceae bacterium]